MIKAVLFDMDGVLINSEPYYMNQMKVFFDQYDILCEKEELYAMIGKSIEDVDALLKSIWNRSSSNLDFNKCFETFDEQYHIAYQDLLFDDVLPLLKELKKRNLKIGIASSSPIIDIQEMIKNCKLEDYIDFWISGEQVKNSKPDPEIYETLMRKLKVKKEECLVIEDSFTGIKAAKEADIFTIARKAEFDYIDQSEADVVVEDALQILKFIK